MAATIDVLDFDCAANKFERENAPETGGNRVKLRSVLLVLACGASIAVAQTARAEDDAEKAVEKYRQMLKEDPWSNPGLLDSDRGESLWKTPAGPNNVSLEKCDLGKGPGVVDGAFA